MPRRETGAKARIAGLERCHTEGKFENKFGIVSCWKRKKKEDAVIRVLTYHEMPKKEKEMLSA
jgi:hypothetical protein